MKQRKLSFLFVLLTLVVGVACAPQPTVGEGSEPTEGAAEDIEPTVQDASICEEGFRLFDHDDLAGDPICIPEDPDRVLALEIGALETALLADKNVVGTANWLHSEIPVLMPELALALDGIMDTGYPANLEVVLEADPDIILGVEGDIDIEAGNEIAPVVMPVAGLENDWQRNMAFWSEVLGTQELYADMLANYEARINEFQMALTGDPEISLIGTSSYGTYMWLEDSAPGEILADAELERPESQAVSGDEALERYDSERWILLSDERLDLADADHIFVYSYATTDPETTETENAALEEFKANPVWTTLSANQADQVHYVGPHWWRAQTYLLANKVVNDLFTHLTDASPDTPILNFEAVGEETSSDACDDGLRAVTDALDTTVCVPEQPKRVISLTDGDTDALMVLAVDPVGISNGRGSQTPPNYLLDYVGEGYVSVGAFFQPNLEMVLELEPDVILFSYGDFAEPELLDQLNAIAPVFVPVISGDGSGPKKLNQVEM